MSLTRRDFLASLIAIPAVVAAKPWEKVELPLPLPQSFVDVYSDFSPSPAYYSARIVNIKPSIFIDGEWKQIHNLKPIE